VRGVSDTCGGSALASPGRPTRPREDFCKADSRGASLAAPGRSATGMWVSRVLWRLQAVHKSVFLTAHILPRFFSRGFFVKEKAKHGCSNEEEG